MEILTSVKRLYISFKSLVNDFVYSFGHAALLLLVEVQNHTIPVRERGRIRVKLCSWENSGWLHMMWTVRRNLLVRKYGTHGNYLHAFADGYAESLFYTVCMFIMWSICCLAHMKTQLHTVKEIIPHGILELCLMPQLLEDKLQVIFQYGRVPLTYTVRWRSWAGSCLYDGLIEAGSTVWSLWSLLDFLL
jgi:hypothetical protein